MAGLATSGSNPDVDLLYDINGLAGDAPGWVRHAVEFIGEYGLLLVMVLLVLGCWWTQRRRAESTEAAAFSAAAALWAPLAAGVAVLVNVPIRGFVERRRPFIDHDGLTVLVGGKDDFSFVSDHATLAMAMAAGLFVASRRFGLIGIVLALAEGFCRIFMGVHYPTDVIGGFALGTAVALLLSPLAMAALTPLAMAVGRSARAGRLIRPRGSGPAVLRGATAQRASAGRRTAAEAEAGRDTRDSPARPPQGAPEPGAPRDTPGRPGPEDPPQRDLAA